MPCLSKYFDGNRSGFMMASIKDDLTAFESIKEKTRPRYKKTWVEFKDFIGAGEEFDSRSPTEEELSSYLCHLRQVIFCHKNINIYETTNLRVQLNFLVVLLFFLTALVLLKNNSTAKMNEYE